MNQFKQWSEEDNKFLVENYNKMSYREIAEILNRAESTISLKAKKLGLNKSRSKWNEEEVQYLKDNYMFKTYKQIADELGKSTTAIAEKLKALDLRGKKSKCTNWSEYEDNFLKENVGSLSYSEISKQINRSISSISNRVYEKGLVTPEFKGYFKLKKEQVLFIVANCDKMTDNQLACKFGVAENTIKAIRKRHGITKTGNEVKGPTSIELFVKEQLDNMNVEYIFNEFLGEYKPDFYIKGTKILIEVNGDYFHCNPKIYKDGPKDEVQIKHVLRDYYKKCYYLSQGYYILELWEHDINHNPKGVIENITAVLGRNS